MAITDATLDTSVWEEVRSLLVANAPYITNPSTSETTTANIRASFKDEKTARPQIVIHPINYDESGWTFNSREGKKMISVVIDCYGSASVYADQLYQQVAHILKHNDIAGIELVGVVNDVALNLSQNNKYHMKSGTFTYDRE